MPYKKKESSKHKMPRSNFEKTNPEAQTPIKHIEKSADPNVREPISHFIPRHDKTVFIQLNQAKINEIAHSISQQPPTWDELNWLISEAELKISSAILSDENPLEGATPQHVKIDRTRIIEHPNEGNIRELAQNISKKQESMEQLYIDLALRQYIFDLVK